MNDSGLHYASPPAGPLEDEVHRAHLRMYVSGYGKSPYGVEWTRYEDDVELLQIDRRVAEEGSD